MIRIRGKCSTFTDRVKRGVTHQVLRKFLHYDINDMILAVLCRKIIPMNFIEKQEISMELHRDKQKTRVYILINLEIILSKLDIVKVVNLFFEMFKGLALKSLGKFMSLLDDLEVFGKERVSSDYKKRHRSTAKEREICRSYDERLKTPWGKIEFRCRQVKKGGKCSIPLREIMGIGPRKMIIDGIFLDAVKTCAIAPSFEKALKIMGETISKSSLWKMFQEYGKRKREEEERALAFFNDGDVSQTLSAGDIAGMMIDEFWIRRRLSLDEKEKAKQVWEKTQQEHKKKEKETGKQQRQVKKRKSGWLKVKSTLTMVKNREEKCWNRFLIYMSCCSVEHYIEKAKSYFNCHLGLNNIPNIFCISDGDSLGKMFTKCYKQAIWLLDWWHLWEHIKILATFSRDLRNEVWELLNLNHIDEVFKILRQLCNDIEAYMEILQNKSPQDKSAALINFKEIKAGEKSWWEKRVKEVKGLIIYLENQRSGIEDYKKLMNFLPPEEIIFGNGPIERLQAVVIGYRMKDQGKIWSNKGAENMIFTLNKLYNDESEREKILELLRASDEIEKMEKEIILHNVHPSHSKVDSSRPASIPGYRFGKRNEPLHHLGRSIQKSGLMVKQKVS